MLFYCCIRNCHEEMQYDGTVLEFSVWYKCVILQALFENLLVTHFLSLPPVYVCDFCPYSLLDLNSLISFFAKYLLASRFSRLFYNFSMNNVCLYCGTKSFFAAFAHYQFAIAIMHLWLLLLFTMQGEEQQTVDGLLHSLGLGKYAILFKAEEVCYSTPSPPKKKKKKLNALLKLS